ncbi:MAG: leucine-rich repeat protein [Faecalibacterium sp.]
MNIADGVEYIEAGAFNGCTALTDITIPESVGYIKTGAFKDCNALTSVTIRDNCRLDMNVFPTTVEVNHSEG